MRAVSWVGAGGRGWLAGLLFVCVCLFPEEAVPSLSPPSLVRIFIAPLGNILAPYFSV